MAKTPLVKDAEIIACIRSAADLLAEMHDFSDRIQQGKVETIENPLDYARQFAHIARAATSMMTSILYMADLQKKRAEVEALRRAGGAS